MSSRYMARRIATGDEEELGVSTKICVATPLSTCWPRCCFGKAWSRAGEMEEGLPDTKAGESEKREARLMRPHVIPPSPCSRQGSLSMHTSVSYNHSEWI